MSTINKQSVRHEFERIKSEFKVLSAANKVSPEIAVLFNGLLMLLELVLSIFMERVTKKTSKNSSLPPSQTEKDESSKSEEKKATEKKSGEIKTASNTRTIETVEILPVTSCERCGEPLDSVDCKGYERRTRIDIVFEKTVSHMDAEIKSCPRCLCTSKGRFPPDMAGPVQYGVGIQSYVIQLLVSQMISLKRAQKMLEALIGQKLSESTLLGYICRLHEKLADWEEYAKLQLLAMPCIHSDETSLRVAKKNHWIHVYSGGEITLKLLHKKRGKEAMEGIDILPKYGGVVVHDCWSSYLSYTSCKHSLCGSHLLRELTFVEESNGYAWAKNMKRLLKNYCRKISDRPEKSLNAKEYAVLQKHYRNLLTRGRKELPKIIKSSKGKRGRMAKSDAHNLWERFKKYESEILRFAKLSEVSFTNNRAERDLRMAKVKQKVSGCFRTEKQAHAYCRISSYLQTMSNQSINPLIAIQMALAGNFKFQTSLGGE